MSGKNKKLRNNTTNTITNAEEVLVQLMIDN